MQKQTMRSLRLAALLSASAYAQSSSTVTSTIPVCPTAASVTVTLPTTVTFCPGPYCNGGGSGPQITAPPTNGVGMPGVNVGQYTSVGPGGKTTVLGIWETVYDSMCESGLVPVTYTITAECPCEMTPHPTVMPAGFETTVVPCSVCSESTVTITQPCPTGPYASQTPSVGQTPALPMPAAPVATQAAPVAGASAGAGSGATAAAGVASPVASAGSGSGSGAAAQAGPGAASAAAGSGSGANANAEPAGAAANAGSGSGANAVAPANNLNVGPIAANGSMPEVPANNVTRPGSLPVQSYVSSAGQSTVAGLTLFISLIATLLL